MEFNLNVESGSKSREDKPALRGSKPRSLLIKHKGEELLFVIGEMTKLTINGDDPKLYGYALEFLRSRDLEDKFFRIYKEAYNLRLNDITNLDEKLIEMRFLLGKLLENLDSHDLTDFLLEHKDKDSFVGSKIKDALNMSAINDGEGTVAQTYTRNEYIALVALLLQQQLLLPVFIDYLPNKSSKHSILEKPSTLIVLDILESLGVLNKGTPAYRLLIYIEAHITALSNGNKDKLISISSFYKVVEEDLSKYILSSIMCKNLPCTQPICKIAGRDRFKDLATTVFGVVVNHMTENAEKTPNKINPVDAYNGEGKDSLFESNKVTTNITQSDEAIILSSLTTDTKEDLENLLSILLLEYRLVPSEDDIKILHKHRKKTNGFYIREANIWFISIFSSILVPSKFLDILDPSHIYNLNSIIYTLVNKLLGGEHAALYSILFTNMDDSMVIPSKETIDRDVLTRLEKCYPLMEEYKGGSRKLVILLWVNELKRLFLDHGLTNMYDNIDIRRNRESRIVELLITSVEKRS